MTQRLDDRVRPDRPGIAPALESGRAGGAGRSFRLQCAVATLAFSTLAPPSESEEVPDLTNLSLEALASLEVVYAASKHEENTREAPSSVTIVTEEQIRRHGYRNLAEVLRSVPGFFVTDDRSYAYVGVRGFGRPGDYNSRILLLVDGARTNDAVLDQAGISDSLVDVEMIERVEVVRGPGSSLHGNSAFFAVVNVVTRRGRDLQGLEAAAEAGNFGARSAHLAFGRDALEGVEVAVAATFREADGERLYFPEYDRPETAHGVTEGTDNERVYRLLGSVSWSGFRLAALHVDREKGVPTGAFGTLFGDPRSRGAAARSLVELRHQGARGPDFTSDLRLQFGRLDYEGVFAVPVGPQAVGFYRTSTAGRWWIGSGQAEWQGWARQKVTFGGEAQLSPRQDQRGAFDGAPTPLTDVRSHTNRWALYVQDEVRLGPDLRLEAGLRYDRYETFGDHLSPRAGLVWLPHSNTAVKLLYGSAFRAPNEYELHYWPTQPPGLRPETVETWEVVGDRLFGPDVRVTASLFFNRSDDLIAFSSAQDYYAYVNLGAVDSRGGEATVAARLGRHFEANASYAFQKSRERDTGRELTNSARHQVKAALVARLPRSATFGVDLVHSSRRLLLSGETTPGFAVVNATLRLPRVAGALDLSLSGYNLLDARYADPASAEHLQGAIPRPRRSFLFRIGGRF